MVNLIDDYRINLNKEEIKKGLVGAGFTENQWKECDDKQHFYRVFDNIAEAKIKDKEIKLSIECEIIFLKDIVKINYVLFGGGEICVRKELTNEKFLNMEMTDFLAKISIDINNLKDTFSFQWIENLYKSIEED